MRILFICKMYRGIKFINAFDPVLITAFWIVRNICAVCEYVQRQSNCNRLILVWNLNLMCRMKVVPFYGLFGDCMNGMSQIFNIFACHSGHRDAAVFGQVNAELFCDSLALRKKAGKLLWFFSKNKIKCQKVPLVLTIQWSRTCQFDRWYDSMVLMILLFPNSIPMLHERR